MILWNAKKLVCEFYRMMPFPMTSMPDFKVTPLFDAEHLRNGTIPRHSYNVILTGLLHQGCHYYGRPLSVSGRPCYILPMFIYLFINRAPSVSCATRLKLSICLFFFNFFLSGNIFRTAEPISTKVCTVTASGQE